MKKRYKGLYIGLLVVVNTIVLNLVVTSMINRFKHPQLTETELFFRVPHAFIWNFK